MKELCPFPAPALCPQDSCFQKSRAASNFPSLEEQNQTPQVWATLLLNKQRARIHFSNAARMRDCGSPNPSPPCICVLCQWHGFLPVQAEYILPPYGPLVGQEHKAECTDLRLDLQGPRQLCCASGFAVRMSISQPAGCRRVRSPGPSLKKPQGARLPVESETYTCLSEEMFIGLSHWILGWFHTKANTSSNSQTASSYSYVSNRVTCPGRLKGHSGKGKISAAKFKMQTQ